MNTGKTTANAHEWTQMYADRFFQTVLLVLPQFCPRQSAAHQSPVAADDGGFIRGPSSLASIRG